MFGDKLLWCCDVWVSLTSTSRVRTTVSIRPVSGTVATSLPHSTSVFRASALTFRFTWPVCTQTQSLLTAGLYWLPLPVTLSHFVYGGRTAFLLAFQSNSLSSLRLHPSSSPCVLCYSSSLIPICCLIILPLPHTLTPPFLPSYTAHNPSQRTSTDHPPREQFLTVSSEILPDLLVQVIVSIPLRGRAIWHSSEPRLHPCWWRLIEILCFQARQRYNNSLQRCSTQQLSVPLIQSN